MYTTADIVLDKASMSVSVECFVYPSNLEGLAECLDVMKCSLFKRVNVMVIFRLCSSTSYVLISLNYTLNDYCSVNSE